MISSAFLDKKLLLSAVKSEKISCRGLILLNQKKWEERVAQVRTVSKRESIQI